MNLSNLQLDKQKKILIVIICAIIIYVDASFILKTQIAALNSLNSKIVRSKSDLVNLNRDLIKMRASKGGKSEVAQKTIIKSSKLLLEGQLSGLLRDISIEANKFDIKIYQIRPGREIQAAKSAVGGDKFIPVLITLDLTGDYHNLGKFINNLENFPVFLGVQELKVSTGLADYLKQKIILALKTYVAK
jgi:Tfp pilus assembly protein PilO